MWNYTRIYKIFRQFISRTRTYFSSDILVWIYFNISLQLDSCYSCYTAWVLGSAMGQAISCWPLTADTQVQSQTSPYVLVVDKVAMGQVSRCIHIVEKMHLLAWTYPSVWPSTCISANPSAWISIKHDIGDCMKICLESPDMDNIWLFTWRPKYILLLLVAKWNHHESAVFKWNGIRWLW